MPSTLTLGTDGDLDGLVSLIQHHDRYRRLEDSAFGMLNQYVWVLAVVPVHAQSDDAAIRPYRTHHERQLNSPDFALDEYFTKHDTEVCFRRHFSFLG